ncbi:hypothetical protein DFJ73DRAFT_816056 [Zopfochytrium polystomum]|nr:hypothetical protein DFJ73DRAFT_816056 [Zopfochytrium polystomum]
MRVISLLAVIVATVGTVAVAAPTPQAVVTSGEEYASTLGAKAPVELTRRAGSGVGDAKPPKVSGPIGGLKMPKIPNFGETKRKLVAKAKEYGKAKMKDPSSIPGMPFMMKVGSPYIPNGNRGRKARGSPKGNGGGGGPDANNDEEAVDEEEFGAVEADEFEDDEAADEEAVDESEAVHEDKVDGEGVEDDE